MLKKVGFEQLRQRGSHVFLKHTDGRVTIIPIHKGETIGPGLLSKILRDAEMTRDDLLKIMKRQPFDLPKML